MFCTAFSGLWWAVATLTTVGYGDIYPVTVPGRIMGAFVAFSGLAAVAIPTGIISSGLMEAYSDRSKAGDARRQDEAVAKMVEEHGAMLKKILDKLSEADTPAQ